MLRCALRLDDPASERFEGREQRLHFVRLADRDAERIVENRSREMAYKNAAAAQRCVQRRHVMAFDTRKDEIRR